MTISPLDAKALASIALLSARREAWAVITYGDLSKRIGYPQQGLGPILDRVGAWCFSIHKQSLAMLVIGINGEPSEGMFRNFPGDNDPVTRDNYERRRVQLWREDWSEISFPTIEEIAVAYDAIGH